MVECEVLGKRQQQRMQGSRRAWSQPDMLRLLVGDRSGARSQLSIPYEPQYALQVSAEMA